MKTVDTVLARRAVAVAPWESTSQSRCALRGRGHDPAAAEAASRVKWKTASPPCPATPHSAHPAQRRPAPCPDLITLKEDSGSLRIVPVGRPTRGTPRCGRDNELPPAP